MFSNYNIDKLDFHFNTFQEGLNVLLSSKNKKDFEEKFVQFLKDHLDEIQLKLYYSTDKLIWNQVSPSDNNNSVKFPLSDSIQIIENIPFQKCLSAVIPFDQNENYAIVLFDKQKLTKFDDVDKLNLKLFAQLLYNGYITFQKIKNEKELIFSLNNRIMQMNTLIDTGIELARLDNVSKLISLSLERAVSLTNSSKGVVIISRNDVYQESAYFPIQFEFVRENYSSKNMIHSEINHQDIKIEYFLIEKESRNGIINFDETDYLLANAITRQVAAALQNDYLVHQLIDKQKIEKELELAAEIQRIIIPETVPEIEGYKVAGINIPSKEVGGDYYDVIKLKDGRYAFVVADVTGKGVPAALLVSTLNAALTAYIDQAIPLSDLGAKLNSIIYKASTRDKFITFFIAILTPENGNLEILNAGHNPSMLLNSKGELKFIEAGGLALGMFDMGIPFSSQSLTLKKGDRLLLFSDGIPEAMDENDEEFSDERFEKLFTDYTPEDPGKFIDKLLKQVKSHAGSAPQSDDITALYLYKP